LREIYRMSSVTPIASFATRGPWTVSSDPARVLAGLLLLLRPARR
jgi:hypothetical protein